MKNSSVLRLLQAGLDLHQHGDMGRAATIYRTVLSDEPDNADALHLLGMLHLERLEYDLALPKLQRAIEISPGIPTLHNSLGVCFLQREDLASAILHFSEAIRQDSNFVDAHENLGVCHFQDRNWTEAIEEFELTLNLSPDRTRAKKMLTCAARQVDDCEKVVHHGMPLVLADQASETEVSAVAASLCGLPAESICLSQCRDEIANNPTHVAANQLVGCVLASRLSALHRAKLTLPQQQQLRQSAVQHLLHAANIRRSCLSFDLAGRTLAKLGNATAAIRCLRRAVESNPRFAPSHEQLGSALLDIGEIDQAREAFEFSVRLFPGSAMANYELARLGDATTKTTLHDLERILSQRDPCREDQVLLHLALAHRQSRLGRYGEAARNVIQSGRIKTQDESRICSEVFSAAPVIAAFPRLESSAPPGSTGQDEPGMIFIVGLPRSGTTLVEQILSCHREVLACGELEYVSSLAASLQHRFGLDDGYPEACRYLDEDQRFTLRQEYVQGVDSLIRESQPGEPRPRYRYMIDKMPTNFRHLGFIRQLFPEAKIIDVVRDVRDVAVSCLFQNLTWPLCSPEPLLDFVREYRHLMDHFRSVAGSTIHTIRYEQLIESQRETTASLLQYLDLPWQEDCMNFHQSKRVVNTPSKQQVRKPLYKNSVGSWTKYRNAMPDFFEQLEVLLL